MSRLIEFSVNNKKVIIILSIILMFSGILSYSNIPRQENPDVSSPSALITTIYPGATAEEVEEFITKKIETEVSVLEGIESIESISSNNVSVVIVTINYSVDKNEQWANLDKIINSLDNDLPEGAFSPNIDTESMVETAGMIISLYSDYFPYEDLTRHAESLKQDLMKVSGIKKIEIAGNLNKQVNIDVNINLLNRLNLSIDDIYNILMLQNIEIPSGSINTDSGKINVSIPGAFSNINDIENTVINISEGFGVTRLKDIADVYLDYDFETKKFEANGKPLVLLTAYFKENQNIIKTGKEITKILENTDNTSNNLSIEKTIFQPDDVTTSVNKFILSLLQGIIFVILIILFGMGWKNAAIVSTAMPFSILVTFTFMRLINIDIHQISISALIIALGILVDNSIVVTDSIQHKIDEGFSPKEASILGANETSSPVFSSTLTTIAAFAPLIVLPGEAGEFASSLPIVVIVSLIVSYLSAMLLVPALTSIFLSKNPASKIKKTPIRNLFEKSLNIGINHSKIVLTFVFTFFIVSVGIGFFFLPIEIFPYADKDYIYIDVSNEKKGDIEDTEHLMNSIYDILNQEESISSFTSSIGGYLPKFYLTIAPGADAAHKGQILAFIELNNNFTSKEAYAYYLDSKLNSIIVGGNIDVNLPALTAPTADIEIILYSEDKSSLYSYADTLSSKIINLESIEKVDNNIPKASYQYELLINDDLSTFLGLTKYDIQKQVNMALTGIKTSTLIVDNVEYDIYLKSNISSITDIENFKIKSSFTGNKILLKQVAEMGLKAETPIIYRYDRIPSVTIKAKIAEGYSVQSSQKYIEELVNNTLNQDIIQVSYKGEKDTINKYLGGIAEAALYALAAIYVILLIQFKSSRQALIILMTVPLSIIGSIAGLYLFKQPFSFTAGLGLASLIGIVVNNAILLLEYINSSIFEGNSIKYSCVSSLERRYRPIMLSTITTIMGLIPLAFSGSSFFVPMAVTLMSGLFISTFFTLIVIPTLFNSMFEKSKKYNS